MKEESELKPFAVMAATLLFGATIVTLAAWAFCGVVGLGLTKVFAGAVVVLFIILFLA